ncbi:MAG: chemotaxis protein CheD [Acetobacteraceae bacterium]|nr:chemotaxis protein CheD [Acetobacteraceae bacterium]
MNASEGVLVRPQAPLRQVSIMQGDIHCRAEPRILLTVLGSCVAVCLWDRALGIGGMNHFVLPSDPRGEKNPRYGDVAIDELQAGLLRLGCRVADLQAKVFGGAAVLASAGRESVGTSNVRLALVRLQDLRIPVTAQRTGGTLGQQIRFNTGTGEVFFRHIPQGTFSPLAADGLHG